MCFEGSKKCLVFFFFLLKNGATKLMYTFLQVASLKEYVFYYKWPQIKQFLKSDIKLVLWLKLTSGLQILLQKKIMVKNLIFSY